PQPPPRTQTEKLARVAPGVREDRVALGTVEAALKTVKNHGWLEKSGIEEATDKFMSILNPTQQAKFLLWTDHNSEAIDQLDYVNAPPASAGPAKTPVFYFGDQEDEDEEDDEEEGGDGDGGGAGAAKGKSKAKGGKK
ncbi:hypothetical protein TeGR_g5849, partial [Tetraparma gracilis]